MRRTGLILLLAGVVWADEKPAVLRAAESAGDAIRTARVSYSRWRRQPDTDVPAHVFYYSFECTASRYVCRFWGDEEGVVLRGEDGKPATQYSFAGPRHMLCDEADVWIHPEDDPGAEVWAASERHPYSAHVIDLRRISINPNSFQGSVDDVRRRAGLAPAKYTVSVDGELDVVATTNESGWTTKWWIDRSKDFSAVKAQTLDGNKLVGEVRYGVERIDGVWFTTLVERFRSDAGDRPVEVVQVHAAEFNRPEHVQELTPRHIGVEVGMDVRFNERPEQDGYWDGDRVIGVDAFFRKLQSGELVRGPGVAKALASLPRVTPEVLAAHRAAEQAGRPDVPGNEAAGPRRPPVAEALRREADSAWARYTRRFITDFGLDREQSQKAWDVLRDCQEQAGRYLTREHDAFAKLEESLTRSDSPAPTSSPALDARIRGLREPIDKIFESELQPRLQRLPTRAQRARAGRQP